MGVARANRLTRNAAQLHARKPASIEEQSDGAQATKRCDETRSVIRVGDPHPVALSSWAIQPVALVLEGG